ncbi:MAG: lysophospholipase [Flammeovirgaceae bacterium]|nr:lysophospholipase [Flammeovirgaceae bacterium]
MEILTDHISTSDGLTLKFKYWTPENYPKAIICLVHGFGEHQDRYQHVAEFFTKKDIGIFTYDQRGHGISEGKRGHTPSFRQLMEDLDQMLDLVIQKFPDLPIFLYGHSMGGNVVLNYNLHYQKKLKGIIATSPWLGLAFQPPKIKVALGKIVNSIFPKFTEELTIDSGHISRDKKIVEMYKNDPLVHGKITVRAFLEIQHAGENAIENAYMQERPLYLCHGTADKVTSALASETFAKNAGSLVKFQLWEDCFHEIHNEPEKEKLFETILGFIRDYI